MPVPKNVNPSKFTPGRDLPREVIESPGRAGNSESPAAFKKRVGKPKGPRAPAKTQVKKRASLTR